MKATYSLQEHQEKKLIPKDLHEMIGSIQPVQRESLQILNESAQGKKGRKLVVKMEAIHVGRTKNFTYYTEEGLKAGLHTWTQPYNKPVLTHHNEHTGEPIGRILEASYEETTLAGKSGLVFTVEITDPQAIEKVLDGRYSTVSIGASTNKVTCNICGTDRTESWCDHYPGEKYGENDDAQYAHLIVGETYGREVSYVNTPADENAGNRSVSIVEESAGTSPHTAESNSFMKIFQVAEGLMQSIEAPETNLYESLQEDARKVLDSLINIQESGESPVAVNNENPETPVQTQEGDQAQAPIVTVNESDLQVSLTEAEKKISTLEADLAESQKALAKAVIEKDKFSVLVEEKEQENTRILAENATLLENEHKMLATRVVELKQRLCKADVVGKETDECVTDHVARTKESLNDSLSELLMEMKQAKPAAGSITNPGQVEDETNLGENEKDKTKYSLKEAEDLIKGMFGRTKKQ